MKEVILNIFVVIDKGMITALKAKSYQIDGTDQQKINFLKEQAKTDLVNSFAFNAPQNKNGEFMSYKKFSKLEKQGMQYRLFEEIFEKFNVPQNPLVCVTPVVDGEVFG